MTTDQQPGNIPADPGGDRELWAVLVALEPLDNRKWDHLNLQNRTFHADAMLTESWSSGERVLIQVAQSLWNAGKVDLGYIASAIGGRHLQAIIDATAIRAGQPLRSDTGAAITRVSAMTLRRGQPSAPRSPAREYPARDLPAPAPRCAQGLER